MWGVERVPIFWRFQTAGWAAFIVFSFPLKWVILQSVRGSLLVSLYRDCLAFLLTLGMRELYRRIYRRRLHPRWIALIVVGGSVIGGVALTSLSLLSDAPFDFHEETLFATSASFGVFYFRGSLLFGWSLLYFVIRQMREGSERDLRLAHSESEKRGAELQMLRAQMNPHFLFNALNTIRAGIAQDSTISALDGLSGYLHYSLAHRRDDLVAVEDEFDALLDYLAVEKARFGENLNLDCRMDKDAKNAAVPGILLQPLVENAIKYGRATSPFPLHVSIRVFREGEFLGLEVTNTGKWVEPPGDSQIGGVGLGNLRRRLSLLFPDRHTFEIATTNGEVAARIRIPFERLNDE